MTSILTDIPRQTTQMIPPRGAEPAGVTADGKHQLYRLTRKMVRTFPKRDKDGEKVWRTHMFTGEQLYPVNDFETYDEHLLFYLEDQGNFNVRMVQYEHPTEEELARIQRERDVEEMLPAMAAALLDRGLTPDTIDEWLEGGATDEQIEELEKQVEAAEGAEPESDEEDEEDAWEPDPDVDYPNMWAPGRWRLSNGDSIQGKREDAEKAEEKALAEMAEEEARQEAKANQDALPEL